MEPEGPLPFSKAPATCPNSEPDQSSPCPHIPFPEDPYYYLPIYIWVFQVVSFLSGFPTCIQLSSPPICATCPAHLILPDLIARTILGEEYRSLNSSLCCFLHSPVTSSLLGPNILLRHPHPTYSFIVVTKFHAHTKQQAKLWFSIS